jgi:hypothetical protein
LALPDALPLPAPPNLPLRPHHQAIFSAGPGCFKSYIIGGAHLFKAIKLKLHNVSWLWVLMGRVKQILAPVVAFIHPNPSPMRFDN